MTMDPTRVPAEHLAAATVAAAAAECPHARIDLWWGVRESAVHARCATCGVEATVGRDALISETEEVDLDALLAETFGAAWAARRKAG